MAGENSNRSNESPSPEKDSAASPSSRAPVRSPSPARSPSPQVDSKEGTAGSELQAAVVGSSLAEVPAEESAEAVAPEGPQVITNKVGDDCRLCVAVRCRPLSEREREGGGKDICRVVDQRMVIILDPGSAQANDYLRLDKLREKRYAFDYAFGPESGTPEVFAATTKPLVGAVLQAYNATVFAYGMTGAGKTFTMIGTPAHLGVMPLTLECLFEQVQSMREDREVTIKCSFLEVYNENLRDLLSPEKDYLDLREDPVKGMCVSGLADAVVESSEEVMDLLQRGNQNRTTEPTAMNVTSSRSHAVLQVSVEQRQKVADPLPGAQREAQQVLLGKLSMIDLAGAERASQTDNKGVRLIEGANINRSLLALGNCINALASGAPFVPYRDSKLTRLLKDSLGGNCRTAMIANISGQHFNYEDTLNTLKYANRAKNIKCLAKQNVSTVSAHIGQAVQLIDDLRAEVAALKAKLGDRVAPAPPPSANGDDLKEAAEERVASERWKEEVVQNLEHRMNLQQSMLEVDSGLQQWHVERQKAKDAIAQWDLRPQENNSRKHGQPRSLEEWGEHLQQINESIKEHEQTKKSLDERLRTNKAISKDLHAQLPKRVQNDDLRSFLELVYRAQVLEVERLELDHLHAVRKLALEEKDREVALLRQQLQLRNSHLAAQRELLSADQQKRLPDHVSLLETTLTRKQDRRRRDPLTKLQEDCSFGAFGRQEKEAGWDNRPLRQRSPEPQKDPLPFASALAAANEAGAQASDSKPTKASRSDLGHDDTSPRTIGRKVEWRNLPVPQPQRIRGVARIQPPGEPITNVSFSPPGRQFAPKGWQEPPILRRHPEGLKGHQAGSSAQGDAAREAWGIPPHPRSCPPRGASRNPPRRRGSTEDNSDTDDDVNLPGRRRSVETPPHSGEPLRRPPPGAPYGAAVVDWSQAQGRPNNAKLRSRSDHVGDRSIRSGVAGRMVIHNRPYAGAHAGPYAVNQNHARPGMQDRAAAWRPRNTPVP